MISTISHCSLVNTFTNRTTIVTRLNKNFRQSVTTGKAGGLTARELLKAVYLTDQLTTIRWSPI